MGAGFSVTDAIGSIQLDFSIFQAEHLLLYMMNAKRHCQQFQYFDCVSVLFAVSVGTPERRPRLAFFATVFTPSRASSPHPPPWLRRLTCATNGVPIGNFRLDSRSPS